MDKYAFQISFFITMLLSVAGAILALPMFTFPIYLVVCFMWGFLMGQFRPYIEDYIRVFCSKNKPE